MFDQHGNWTSNTGGDNTPICTYVRNGSEDAGTSQWPPIYPWLGELDCYSTDGSNKVFRQAYTYNTIANRNFPIAAQIPEVSSDGAWMAFTSDWFCTLGSTGNTPTNVCGLPFQASHNYAALRELVAPNDESTGTTSFVYQVTTTGTSGPSYPRGSTGFDGCTTPGCTVTSGTVTFTYYGVYNALPAVFIAKLQ
jgi:hypothetical protein